MATEGRKTKMRKSSVLLAAQVFLWGMAPVILAQQAATSASAQHPAHSGKVLRGTVDKVILADSKAGAKPQIAVVDAQNKSLVFLVQSTTTLYDALGGAITLDKIVKGDKVRIRYRTTADGIHEAASVRLIKQG